MYYEIHGYCVVCILRNRGLAGMAAVWDFYFWIYFYHY